jgi:hypothetical protein
MKETLKGVFVEIFGRSAVVYSVIIKSLGFIGLIDVNNALTILMTIVGICYMAFRALNEYQKYKTSRKKDSTKASQED